MSKCTSACPYWSRDTDCCYCSARGGIPLDLKNYDPATCEYYIEYRKKKAEADALKSDEKKTPSSNTPISSFEDDAIRKYKYLFIFDIILVIVFIALLKSEGVDFKSTEYFLNYMLLIKPAKKYVRAMLSVSALVFFGGALKNLTNRILVEFTDNRRPAYINNVIYNVINLGVLNYALSRFGTSVFKNAFHGIVGALEYLQTSTDNNINVIILILFFMSWTVLRLIKNILKSIFKKY